MQNNALAVAQTFLQEHGAFESELCPVVDKTIATIPYRTVPYRMKATIATSEVMTFASQFRRNILLEDETLVPINTVSFVLTGSGQNKDSSVRAARKAFKDGYSMVEDFRGNLAKQNAIRLAREAGEDLPEEWDIYRKYYKKPPPIFIAPTTGPGFVEHINDLSEHTIGAGLLYSGEFADELAYNGDMLEDIKIIAECFDLGEKEVKYTKSVESRSREISGQPVSALMVSSPTYILYDASVKKKFEIAFMSKLARRSWFCYAPELIEESAVSSVEDIWNEEEDIESRAADARKIMQNGIKLVAEHNLKKAGKPITVTTEVSRLFKVYKRYNKELADLMPNQHSTAVLVRRHLQWKALKLAGALALFDLSDTIDTAHYIYAIRFCELLADDMGNFEAVLNKFDYERFADYIKTLVNSEGTATISVHDIKKMGFISSVSHARIQELIMSASSYDKTGVYSISKDDTSVTYSLIFKTDVLTISYLPVDTSPILNAIKHNLGKDAIDKAKSVVAHTTVSGFTVEEATFVGLGKLLEGEYAYSPFPLKDGTRGMDNIIGGTKVAILDVDTSTITAEECHFLLSDLNHHIALSSDKDNQFKFRVIIELDSVVTLERIEWTNFVREVGSYLSLDIDPLPQSQIFYSYPDRTVLSVVDAEPLPVRDFVMRAKERALSKELPSERKFTPAQRKALLDDELTTFAQAFEARDGEGSRKLIWAAKYAYKDLGMTKEETVALIHRINDYWSLPMPEDRLEHTILSQISRF